MEIKSYYKTQREIAEVLNYLVDSYWKDRIDEKYLTDKILSLHVNNPGKFIKNNNFTSILKQQCGKRRLEVVERILNSN